MAELAKKVTKKADAPKATTGKRGSKKAEAAPVVVEPKVTSVEPKSTSGKATNVGAFTQENFDMFLTRVEKKGDAECWPWKGATAKNNNRHFGIIRFGGAQGYVMQQRFMYIMTNKLPAEQFGIKVKPAEGCKLGEMCCNPKHIVPKVLASAPKAEEAKEPTKAEGGASKKAKQQATVSKAAVKAAGKGKTAKS